MPSSEREASRDGDRLALVHRSSAHSIGSIDSGRAIVPMWDSSDPERAPPPLPMNPSSPNVSSRGTSAAIKSAHAALTERARDNTYNITIPPPKRLTEPSPERLLIKGTAPNHKRMQSLQNGNVRDLSSFIESGTFGPLKPPEKSSTRPATPHASKDFGLEPPEKFSDRMSDKDSVRATTPTKNQAESPRERRNSMHVRPSLRRPPHSSMFGENTPPQSATMQALHNMTSKETDPPLANVTNGSTAYSRQPQTFDAISNQILSLTSICTSLQREMAQLSRRSKDNATDLVSLKEATNARDEDIRKSLRELVTGLSDAGSERTLYGGNNHFAESKGRASPSSSRNSKGFSLPRIPSPNSFAASLDRETLLSTPFTREQSREHSSDAVAHAATVALLEKILREMGTKEGQELLISRLTEIAAQLGREGMSTAKKLEELVEFIKKNTEISQALIAHHQNNGEGETRGRKYSFEEDAPRLELDFDRPPSVAQRLEALVANGVDRERRKSQGPSRSGEILSDDVLQVIRSLKDSVAQGGGLTAEVKALVRELRGEVLGMGREIGRKLDQASKDGVSNGADVTGVVQNGLEELKEHMNQLIRESRRQNSASAATQKIDYKEVYNVVRSAVTEKSESKEDIIDAVREAWENYKPDIELQHFGLEREELLVCLKEGIQEFAPQNEPGATRDEVFAAVIEGLKHFTPPPVDSESLTRDEILDAVRECLEEFEFPAAPMPEPREPEITRDDMLNAVAEGLRTFDFSANPTALSAEVLQGFTQTEMIQAVREGLKEFDFSALDRDNDGITRADVVTAIREGLQSFGLANQNREIDGGVTRDDVVGAVIESLHTFDFSAHMPHHNEEAITRNDMFDAVRAGLESYEFPTLSREVGDSITRADVFDAVKESLHNFDFGALIPASDPDENETGISREDVFEAVKDGLQTFDFALTRDVGGNTGINRDDIFDAVKEGLHSFDSALTRDVSGSGSLTRNDVMDAVKDVLTTFDSALTRGNAETGATRAEIVDAMQEVMTKFHGSTITQGPSQGITREDVVDAVQEVLQGFNSALTKNAGGHATRDEVLEAIKVGLKSQESTGGITRNDVHEVIKENLQGHHTGNGLTRDEVVDAVQEVLRSFDSALIREASPKVTRDDILGAVKEGLQAHTSNVTRDEILQAIKDGLQSKELTSTREDVDSITRDDVFDAVKNGFEIHDIGGSVTRDDILEAVKKASFTREDILDAVKDGLQTFDSALTRGVTPTCTKADVFEAVRVGLQSQRFPSSVTREDVVEAVSDGLQTFNSAIVSVREANASKGDVFDAVKEGFETFNNALTLDIPVGVSRDDVLDAVKEGLQTFDSALTRGNDVNVNREEILGAVKEGLENFDFTAAKASTALTREVTESITRDEVIQAVEAGLGNSPQSADNFTAQVSARIHEIMESMRNDFKAVSDEAKQNAAANGRDAEKLLDATKDGFEKLRSDIEAYVDRASDVTGKDEILENMRDNFATLRSEVEELISKSSTSGFETVNGELEHLRGSIASSLVRSGASDDKDEILDALKEGFDGIKANMEASRSREDKEDSMPGTGEIIDALQDGFTVLKTEMEKVANKPADTTVNHEILDTLKRGLETVRADLEVLKENQKNEQAVAENSERAIVPLTENLSRNDIENLEMLITQLGIKVAALESTEPPKPQLAPGSVTKEDLAAVEEMLRNVQTKVDSVVARDVIPEEDRIKKEDLDAIEILLHNTKAKLDEIDPEQSARKEDIETMGVFVVEVRDGITLLTEQLEDVPRKDATASIETAVREVLTGLAEIKDQVNTEFKSLDKVTKTDVEAVESVCLDIKSAIEQTVVPEFAALATKDEVNAIGTLVKETAGRIEIHATTNAKAFEERQAETVGVSERVTEVKSFLMEFRDAVKEKLDEGKTNVETVRTFLEGLGETINKNGTISEDLQAMFHAMTEEFEKTNAGMVGSKLETDEKFQQTWDKLDSHFEEKFSEIITKYDELQNFLEERATAGVEKTTEVEANILSTKQVAEDVKLLLDTLIIAVAESAEKMEEASKTVFNRVDETFIKIEETHADAKAEHQLTREQILKTLGVVEGVQGTVTEYNPQILESIKDVLNMAVQHYEHSKTSAETIQKKIDDIPPPPEIPPPVEFPKYDDTPVHEKLDKLADHVQEAGKSIAQLEMLEKLQKQMMATAAEVSRFVSTQTQRIADDHESKEQAAAEAAIALEKRLGQKEQVEASIASLKGEERVLKDYVAKLKTDKEDLIHQKMRLASDVSSLETALRIRREELQEMEERAEGLERRILEGVIDQSRALLLAKGNRKVGRDPMSRKRVSTQRSSTAHSVASSVASKTPSITQEAINIAMKNRSPTKGPLANQAQRRILSLSQINNNLPAGNFKRSHSVKQSGGTTPRKTSWGGAPNKTRNYGELNKENLALKEYEDEDEENKEPLDHDNVERTGHESDSNTMRRSSHGTTVITANGGTDRGSEYAESIDGSRDANSESDYETETDLGTNSHLGTESELSNSSAGQEYNPVVLYEGEVA
ncbi:2fa18f3c-3dfc-43de-a874-4409fff0e880 [Sclerotinia trifoliorum]|uniref:2fa18f3c-3dfc-43de-a874-4409fff0e880 n=1 Tax=Sclerotinia trifoliorum TaxID=28548 RepID=A0A8H2ZNB2_9HELO|nr:2fa18f3c-3dfc-43de-a874-4409fff0e880 [Sclerotinia trifoliorum]